MSAAELSPGRRLADLASLAEERFDVLVVGGGATGTGAALDAAGRGLKVALVEAGDLAGGASGASSKLVHGGVRYLARLEIGLVRQALSERGRLLELAPHLVRPLRFVYPLQRRLVERPYVGAGLAFYDVLAGRRRLGRHRHLGRRQLLGLVPALEGSGVAGAVEYGDAQVDDARLVVTLARTAAARGARIVTGARAVGLLRDRSGAVVGAELHLDDGGELECRARTVLAATGAWAGELAAATGAARPAVRPSKGVHLVVPRRAIASSRALVAPTEHSVLFVLPFGEHWLIGTTDTAWDLEPGRVTAARPDVEYLLEQANRLLAPVLGGGDVEAAFAGLRPLVAAAEGGEAQTARISREHAVERPLPGFYAVSGGKLTTYRVMAADAVDALAADLGPLPPSPTAALALAGADGFAERWAARRALAERHGLELAAVERLLGRYGSLVEELLEGAEGAGLEPLGGGYLAVEARYGASHEGARSLGDVLERRLRLAIESREGAAGASPAVAQLVGPVLGWDRHRQRQEVETYRRSLALASLAEQAPSDAAAAELRFPASRSGAGR